MAVVHLVTRLNVGGIARFLLAGRGAVDLLVRGRAPPGEREARWPGPELRLPALSRPVRPIEDARSLAALVALLRRLRPAALHTHASKAGALGRVAAALLGIPCVHTFHGHVLEGYFPRPLERLLLAAERRLAPLALLTATGPATARWLSERLGAPVEVVAPGVAMPPPSPGARERLRAAWGSPRRVALAVARKAAVKDLPRFVEAARGAGYLPVVAGVSRLPGALALGHVAEMSDLYEAADVVVSSSRSEGTPYALLEALWFGRPVVATPVGDVAWVVGAGGLVTEDLVGALLRLRDSDFRAALGAAGAREVRARFPAPSLPIRLRELYARLRAGF
jgi:glycosyltransferase involved in cell wall biosynthesis